MANADSKKFGAGQQDQGKGDGTGGMSPLEPQTPLTTEVLSNRDTSRHSEQRGLDSGYVQTQQLDPSVDNHAPGAGEPGEVDRDKLADERPSDNDAPTTGRSGPRDTGEADK